MPSDASPAALPHKIVLVDGHALAYRSYFAIKPLTTRAGETVQAIFGFMKTLFRLLREDGHCVIVAFDPPVKTFRHDQFENYKAGRPKTPEDLPGQIDRIRNLVDLLGLVRLEVPGYEADDVIGTLAKRAEALGLEVHILTSDRDSYQLLSDRVKVIRSDWSLFGPAEVQAEYGVTVEQWVDFRALTGDASDNIPGAKGIGKVTAAKLLQEYGSLDTILEQAEQGTLKPIKAGEKIRESAQDVRFSREISRMVTDLDLDIRFEDAHCRNPNLEALTAEFLRLEFKSLLREMNTLFGAPEAEVPEAPRAFEAPAAETNWQAPGAGAVWGYALSKEGDLQAEVQDLAYAEADRVYRAPMMTDPADLGLPAELHAAGAKALSTVLAARGLEVTPGNDPLLMAYLIDPANTHAPVMAERYAGVEWPADVTARAALSRRLLEALPAQMTPEQRRLYDEIERPLSRVLARMELCGVKLDLAYLRGLSERLGAQLSNLEAEIHRHAGREFAISSRDQLEKVLYDELGLSSGKKTKLTGKRSTAASALEPLRDAHPIVNALIEYRELSKLKGTYLDALPGLVNPRTGRVHTTFAQTAVATGRLSSINPNLQNIPVRTELGREIRRGFVAEDGYVLLSADYSQIELRVMAHVSGDEAMRDAFRHGADIHRRTAARILGVSEDTVSPLQRRAAKTINFGVLYGMSAHRLTRELGISYAEAQSFIDGYFGVYPGIRQYIDRTLAFCREHGYVETLLGRRRFVPEVNSTNRTAREAAERIAYNMPIQGTAADIIKIAMVRLEDKLEALGARLLLQVHDELVVEAPEEKAEQVSRVIRDEMQGAFQLEVPLEVEVGQGRTWYDAK
ncbi:DNA polymerase-1 [Deinobacterium chartae]|uniref:DNA polymerase I n=1 Tax=Deinobacterium chartae TaxID=521158 RepID=A0A841HVI3_9DEIO|nr:DNA polymerase I [Deinobacterium chartae]MBB6097511.1 DNA polymerase-1 [Deinobacterium chartae]